MPQVKLVVMANLLESGLVPRVGIEPTRVCTHRFLRPTRLPVPPPGLVGARFQANLLTQT